MIVKGKIFKAIAQVSVFVLVIIMGGVIFFFESRTHNIQIAFADLGWCEIDDSKRPDYYWIQDWTACIKKLNYKADIVFFGNSITAGSDFQVYFPDLKVAEFGHCGDRVDGMIKRIPMVQAVEPDKVFVMGGINDLHRSSPKTVEKRFDELLTRIQEALPNTKIYVQSILPISKAKESVYASNSTIIETNALIEACAKKHRCVYIDLNHEYIENGVLPDSLSIDGVHLKEHAYKRWAKVIKSYVYE